MLAVGWRGVGVLNVGFSLILYFEELVTALHRQWS